MPVSQRQLEERQMRQHRILTGALEVFTSKGLEGATMEEIASESGFGKATLYYYFHSKEEVFAATNQHIIGVYGGTAAAYFADADSITVSEDIYELTSLDFGADFGLVQP